MSLHKFIEQFQTINEALLTGYNNQLNGQPHYMNVAKIRAQLTELPKLFDYSIKGDEPIKTAEPQAKLAGLVSEISESHVKKGDRVTLTQRNWQTGELDPRTAVEGIVVGAPHQEEKANQFLLGVNATMVGDTWMLVKIGTEVQEWYRPSDEASWIPKGENVYYSAVFTRIE